jgi:putative redox protein
MSETRQGMVTVAESGSGPYSQLVHAGRHVLSADEPEASGGHDVGPSPYEYLLAGLGARTAMTLRSYVERHNWGRAGRPSNCGMKRDRLRMASR